MDYKESTTVSHSTHLTVAEMSVSILHEEYSWNGFSVRLPVEAVGALPPIGREAQAQ